MARGDRVLRLQGRVPEFAMSTLAAGLFLAAYAALAADRAIPDPVVRASESGVSWVFAAWMAELFVFVAVAVLVLAPRSDWRDGIFVGQILFRVAPLAFVAGLLVGALGLARLADTYGLARLPPLLAMNDVLIALAGGACFLALLSALAGFSARGSATYRRTLALHLTAWAAVFAAAGAFMGLVLA